MLQLIEIDDVTTFDCLEIGAVFVAGFAIKMIKTDWFLDRHGDKQNAFTVCGDGMFSYFGPDTPIDKAWRIVESSEVAK